MRFGFAVKILGDPNLKSNDSGRWQSGPHLSVSLRYVREILHYLDAHEIRMYRMSSDLAPYLTHPDMPQFHNQIDECLDELASVGALAKEYDIRLSFHPSQYIVLNSPDEQIASTAAKDLLAESRILDAMGLSAEAIVITHVGGVYGDRAEGINRFIERYQALPEIVKRRLVLENDEKNYSISDVLRISSATGVPVVFDYLHHMLLNPDRLEIREALLRALSTWKGRAFPKMHFSTPRTEMREVVRKDTATGKKIVALLPPLTGQHSDYINPFEFAMFLQQTEGLPDFDVMLESKAKDLALLRLREQLGRIDWMLPRVESTRA